jgi:hypothetical protein
MANRTRQLPDFNRDVINAAASYRGNTPDPSAASFLRALHYAHESKKDIVSQGEVESITINNQQFASLRYQQARDAGIVTYESAYAASIHKFVVFFIFGSIKAADLANLEQSMQSFAVGNHCEAVK